VLLILRRPSETPEGQPPIKGIDPLERLFPGGSFEIFVDIFDADFPCFDHRRFVAERAKNDNAKISGQRLGETYWK